MSGQAHPITQGCFHCRFTCVLAFTTGTFQKAEIQDRCAHFETGTELQKLLARQQRRSPLESCICFSHAATAAHQCRSAGIVKPMECISSRTPPPKCKHVIIYLSPLANRGVNIAYLATAPALCPAKKNTHTQKNPSHSPFLKSAEIRTRFARTRRDTRVCASKCGRLGRDVKPGPNCLSTLLASPKKSLSSSEAATRRGLH